MHGYNKKTQDLIINHDPRRINLTATLAITEYCKLEKYKTTFLYILSI